MSPRVYATQSWTLTSFELQDAYTDFVLSRQAKRVSLNTELFYKFTAGAFLRWLESQSLMRPEDITARHVRAYLAELAGRNLADWTINDHARAIRTLLRFFFSEGYIPNEINFEIPRVRKKRLPVLSAEDVEKVLNVCDKREKALFLLMVDTGLRRAETIALNWQDVDISSGLVRVNFTKGGRARSSVIGVDTRRALIQYKRTLHNPSEESPLIQTDEGGRFTGSGILSLFRRLAARSGVKFTPHALRRTFTLLSLRAGMSPLHIQALLGHASLDMVSNYAQMVNDDLLQAHHAHSPVDNLSRLTKG